MNLPPEDQAQFVNDSRGRRLGSIERSGYRRGLSHWLARDVDGELFRNDVGAPFVFGTAGEARACVVFRSSAKVKR